MIEIGEFNTLEIMRETKIGLYLRHHNSKTMDDDDILLPNKYLPNNYEIGDNIEVFVYLDQEHRPVATTLHPYITLNNFAFLRVNYINQFGAFLDWGLEKDIFVPYQEQARPMQEGNRYMVYLFMDEVSKRLVASSKTNQFLDNSEIDLQKGDEVSIIISHITDLGINVIINKKHKGLLYKDEVFDESLRIGDKHVGYIKNIRPDNKIDVSLQKQGFENIEPNANRILDQLKMSKGFLRLNDKSHPEDIKTVLKMSKKTFKKAIGTLYKEKQITIEEDGIHLVNN